MEENKNGASIYNLKTANGNIWKNFKKTNPTSGSTIYVRYGNGVIKMMNVINKNWIKGDSEIDATTILSGMKEWASKEDYEKETKEAE